MAILEFTLIVDGPDLQSDAAIEALYEAGCDDATVGRVGRIQYLDFDRDAESSSKAIDDAVAAVEAAVPGVRVTGPLYVAPMPVISRFHGITVMMYFADHPPPHFHARYGGEHARFSLDGNLIDGHLPPGPLRQLEEWAALHHAALERCWDQARRHEPVGTIEGLP